MLTNLNFRNKIRNIMKRGNSKSSKANYYLTGPDPNNLNILILRYFGDPFFFLEIHSFKVPTYVYIIQNLPKKKAKKYVKTLAAVPQWETKMLSPTEQGANRSVYKQNLFSFLKINNKVYVTIISSFLRIQSVSLEMEDLNNVRTRKKKKNAWRKLFAFS